MVRSSSRVPCVFLSIDAHDEESDGESDLPLVWARDLACVEEPPGM